MPSLQVPIACDSEGRLCSPAEAERGKAYFCPACKEGLIFRQGKIKIAHFAHKVSDNCNQESIIHKTAKLLIQHVVNNWKVGKNNPPLIKRVCRFCRAPISQALPNKVSGSVLEHRLSNGSIVDVALMVGGKAEAAVEIKVTHGVDTTKANDMPIPFIELNGCIRKLVCLEADSRQFQPSNL